VQDVGLAKGQSTDILFQAKLLVRTNRHIVGTASVPGAKFQLGRTKRAYTNFDRTIYLLCNIFI
jgi:hypothetical protein